MGPAVEQVDPAFVAPLAVAEEGVGHRGEDRRAIDHRAIDNLSLSTRAGMQHRRDHAEGQHHPPAAEIAHGIDREGRLLALAAIGMKRARQRDVVDVMARQRRHRSVLAPAGHSTDHQFGIDRQQHIGADPHPFDHARAIAFDQGIGGFDQVFELGDGGRILEVQLDPLAVAVQDVAVAAVAKPACGAGPLNPDHPRAMIGQHHSAERPRPDPGQFDYGDTLKNPGHVLAPDKFNRAMKLPL